MAARAQAILASRPERARVANDRIARRAEQLEFVSRVPMVCECSDLGCSQVVLIALTDYRQLRSNRRRYLTVPGHSLEGATVEERQSGYWLQRR